MSSMLAMATELILALVRTGQLSPSAVLPLLQETHAHLLAAQGPQDRQPRQSPTQWYSGARWALVASQPDPRQDHLPGMWGVVAMALRAPSAQAWLRRAGLSAQVWHTAPPAFKGASGHRAPPTAHLAAAPMGKSTDIPASPGTPSRCSRTACSPTPTPAPSSPHALNVGQGARHSCRAGRQGEVLPWSASCTLSPGVPFNEHPCCLRSCTHGCLCALCIPSTFHDTKAVVSSPS